MEFVGSEHLELKEKVTADFKKEIIVFFNASGGLIYVGVSAAGSVIGVEAIHQRIKESDGTTFDKARSMNQDLTFDYVAGGSITRRKASISFVRPGNET